jgi:hypothetical protein
LSGSNIASAIRRTASTVTASRRWMIVHRDLPAVVELRPATTSGCRCSRAPASRCP